jgi:hypothetical protein
VVADSRSSSTELAAGLVGDAQRLVQLEIALAKQEVKELAIRNGVAVGLMAVAALLAILAIFIAIPVLLLFLISNHVLAAALWIVIYVLGAIALGLGGKFLLRIAPPRKTLASLEETKEWVVHQINSSGK